MEETLATMALAHLQETEELEAKIKMLQVEMETLLRTRWYFSRTQHPEVDGFTYPSDIDGFAYPSDSSDDEMRGSHSFSFAP
jgi:hypothetical protein